MFFYKKYSIVCFVLVQQILSQDQTDQQIEDISLLNKISIFANNISPFDNPVETYKYFDLPFCQPEQLDEDEFSIEESLSGERKVNTLYYAYYNNNITNQTICKRELSVQNLIDFRNAILQKYIIEFHLDIPKQYDFDFTDNDLIIDNIGELDNDQYFLKSHIRFQFFLKDNKVVYHNLSEAHYNDFINITDISHPIEVEFKYSAEFINLKEDEELLPNQNQTDLQQIHWISIINSFILVICLVSFMIHVMGKAIRKDFSVIVDLDASQQDIKWRHIKNEVFYSPQQKNILCAFIGIGLQILTLISLLMTLGVIGVFYGHHVSIKSIALLIFCFTGTINGYFSAKFYKYMGGKHWALNIITTASFLPIIVTIIWSYLNTIAWSAGSTAALPFKTVLYILFIWALVYVPLTLLGGLTARLRSSDTLPLCNERLPRLKKEIPERKWYQKTMVQMLITGLLPFSSIYLELYFVLQSFWGHQIYQLYGVLLLAFVMMLAVSGVLTISMVYFTLNAQDYQWQWKSFAFGGSPAIFFFFYSIYFYFHQSNMFGFIQFSFFFGYSFLISIMGFIMFGSYGFLCSLKFVNDLYDASKLI